MKKYIVLLLLSCCSLAIAEKHEIVRIEACRYGYHHEGYWFVTEVHIIDEEDTYWRVDKKHWCTALQWKVGDEINVEEAKNKKDRFLLFNQITREKVRAKILIPYWKTWDND